MQFDFLLERLQAIQHTLIILFIAGAHRFLLNKLGLGSGEVAFFVRKFILKNLAPVVVALRLGLGWPDWLVGRSGVCLRSAFRSLR